MTALSAWQNFYVIVGSSAGALIGLQFVLITLIANVPVNADSEQAGQAFATPTIVHFSIVLLLAGIATAPWHNVLQVAAAWGLLGLLGVIYILIVTRRMHAQSSYRPEFEDWLFHSYLPLLAYACILGQALAAPKYLEYSLFAAAGSAFLLLFVGIHNAWDAATYHVFVVKKKKSPGSSANQRPSPN